MIGMGTLANTAAVVAGGMLGLALGGGLKKSIQETVMHAMGMATIFIGVGGTLKEMLYLDGGALQTRGTMLLIFSLIAGSLLGAALEIERRLDGLGGWLKGRLGPRAGGRFVEGFVTTSLVICVGAMAVVGSLEDGLNGNAATLYTKSVLDFMIVMILASTLGAGAVCSALPLLVYQGTITLFARALAPLLSEAVISDLSLVGNVLIFGVGVNVAFGKKLAVGNMLPALAVPVLWHLFV